MALAVRVGGGQGPEAIERSVELTTEAEGIEALIQRLEIHAGRGREAAGGAQALVGGLGPIVDAPDASPAALLRRRRCTWTPSRPNATPRHREGTISTLSNR